MVRSVQSDLPRLKQFCAAHAAFPALVSNEIVYGEVFGFNEHFAAAAGRDRMNPARFEPDALEGCGLFQLPLFWPRINETPCRIIMSDDDGGPLRVRGTQ